MPTSIRRMYSVCGLVANMVQVEAIPQTTMIPAIQRRAPTFASMILLGIPHST